MGSRARDNQPLHSFIPTATLVFAVSVLAATFVPPMVPSTAQAQSRGQRISFVVNGRVVPEQTFQATLRRLVRSPSPRISERIVNEDGSHGGHGKTFDARDPSSGERWLYMEVTLRDRSGRSQMSRVLRRARR